jgi:hypothetical protein
MNNKSKKLERPTKQPKTNLIKFRCDAQSKERLEFCAEELAISKSEILRLSIDNLYQEINESKDRKGVNR